MDSFGGSASSAKAAEDENERPEYALNTGEPPSKQKGRRNIMLEKFRVVETEEQQKMLEYYETDAHRIEGIRISVDGKVVIGRTFMWASDPTEPVEGTWSLEEWKKDIEEEMAAHFRPLED